MVGTVRLASMDDVEDVGRVHYEAHVETYSGKFPDGVIKSFPATSRARMWTRVLNENLGELWVAEWEGRIVGFASASSPREE